MDYAKRGFAVLVPDTGFSLKEAVEYMAKIKKPVTVVGTSRGTLRAAYGIDDGARPDRLVLTSGFLSPESGDREHVMRILGKPDLLPPTLLVHHRWDLCKRTLPGGVDPFIAWSKGRAQAKWLTGGESAGGDPCGNRSYHGFNGIDGQVVTAVAAFAGK